MSKGKKRPPDGSPSAKPPTALIFFGTAILTVLVGVILSYATREPPQNLTNDVARDPPTKLPRSPPPPPPPKPQRPPPSTTPETTALIAKARSLIGHLVGWGHSGNPIMDAKCRALVAEMKPFCHKGTDGTKIGELDLLYLRATRVQQNLEPGAEHFETGVKRFTEMKGLSVDVKGWLQVEMGHFYLQWDRLPTAKQWYAQAKAMAPEGSDAYRDALLGSAMHASLSAGCERGGHKTKACADALLEYQRLEKLGHLDAASYFMYAHLLWYTARDPDGALKACNKAVSMNGGSTNPGWWTKLGGWAQQSQWALPREVAYNESQAQKWARESYVKRVKLNGPEEYSAAKWKGEVEALLKGQSGGGGGGGDGADGGGDGDDGGDGGGSAFTLYAGDGDECEVIDTTEAAERWEEIVERRYPLIIRDATTDWPKEARWEDDNAVRSMAGDEIIPVALFNGSDLSRFERFGAYWQARLGPEAARNFARNSHVLVRPMRTWMRFGDFLRVMEHERGDSDGKAVPEGRVYLHQTEISLHCPAFMSWLKVPSWVREPSGLREIHLWWSRGETMTSVHSDSTHNIMAMVKGQKEFLLFSPDQKPGLYYEPVVEVSRQWRPTEQAKFEISVAETNGHGLVDVTKPDLKAHPEYENAKGLRCKVKEGDALFVPANWHHAVHSSSGRNIGISFWFQATGNKFGVHWN